MIGYQQWLDIDGDDRPLMNHHLPVVHTKAVCRQLLIADLSPFVKAVQPPCAQSPPSIGYCCGNEPMINNHLALPTNMTDQHPSITINLPHQFTPSINPIMNPSSTQPSISHHRWAMLQWGTHRAQPHTIGTRWHPRELAITTIRLTRVRDDH